MTKQDKHPLPGEPVGMEKLGFDEWFQERIDPAKKELYDLARVAMVNRDSFFVKNMEETIRAEITGRLMYGADSPLDYPAVGDWVYVNYYDDRSLAIIHEILPRKSVLKRKTAGRKIAFQLIASNIDTAFVVQSLDSNFNIRRLERYLVMIHDGGIEPVVLLSKSDLMDSAQISEKISLVQGVIPDIKVIPFSNIDHSGVGQIQGLLEPGRTFSLIGSSGVGKTTLLNNLAEDTGFKTEAVREKDGKGRHATTNRQLIRLRNGSMIIDTPGMRELGNFDFEAGLDRTFDEISELSRQCRFNNCTHIREDGCAILSALEDGIISEDRYRNYIKLYRESQYYEMSYLEKRQKDKQFGKMVKTVMKHKKNNKGRSL